MIFFSSSSVNGVSLSEMGQSQCLVSSVPSLRLSPSLSIEALQCKHFTDVSLVFMN